MSRRIIIFLTLIVLAFNLKAQEFTAEEKAYLYHAAFNSPKIEHELRYFFHFENDSLPMINDTLPDYDSIGFYIIQKPVKMQWESQFMRGQQNGLLLELCHKLAMRNLNLTIAYNTNMPKVKKEKIELNDPKSYLEILKDQLPAQAITNNAIHEDVKKALASSYTNSDQMVRLNSAQFSESTVKQIIDAINKTNEIWINKETIRIFNLLGGVVDQKKIETYLMAAGDGAGSIDKNNGYEAQIHTPIAQSIYQIVNHFGYGISMGKPNSKGKIPLFTNIAKTQSGKTYGKFVNTNIHFTVWGYSEEAQTTVVVFRDNKAYPLFGQSHHPFLSADSAYNGDRTYYQIINKLENEIIADLKEKLYGKRGFEWLINKNKDYAEDLRMKIKKTEVKLNAMRYGGVPDSKSGKKKKKKTQEYYVWLNTELENTLAEIKKLELAWEEAQEKLSYYETELDKMKRTIGYSWVSYEMKDSVAYFEDGVTFNLRTQDFMFPGTNIAEEYEIRLIAVPEAPLIRNTNEVYVSAIQYPGEPQDYIVYDATYQDRFEKQFPLVTATFAPKDSAIIEQLLVEISQLKKYPEARIVGHGAEFRKGSGGDYISNYPGDTPEKRQQNREDEDFKKLRKVEVRYNLNTHQLVIDGYTDQVIYQGFVPDDWSKDTTENEPQFKNRLVSAAQAMATFDDWSNSLLSIGKDYVSEEVYNEAEKKIKKMRKKAVARFGEGYEIKLKDYEKNWK